MIYPIVAYGHPNLRKKAVDIDANYPELKKFMEDLWETMYKTDGVGLAAPQVNKQIRIFVIDASHYSKDHPELEGFKRAFINARIIERAEEVITMEEGCLSVPGIHEDVDRPDKIHITWYDEEFNFHDEWFEGIPARIIQHEYDHLEGVLFVDKIHPLRKLMVKRKLTEIARGITEARYKMIFAPKSKKGK